MSAPPLSNKSAFVCPKCRQGHVQPGVVLFGQPVMDSLGDVEKLLAREVDVLLIIGTSLTVAPVSELPEVVTDSCVRVVINATPVGANCGLVLDSTSSQRDIFLKGDIDATCLDLITEMGWRDELQAYKDQLALESAKML